MKREALVPVDDEIRAGIGRQQQRRPHRWPERDAGPVPPGPDATSTAAIRRSAIPPTAARSAAGCGLRHPRRARPAGPSHPAPVPPFAGNDPDQPGRPAACRPEDPRSRLSAMTAHYARLSDTTVRRTGKRPQGQRRRADRRLDPDGPLGRGRLGETAASRATQALPNGYCQLPIVKNCPHANSCLTCPMFVTTAEFLPQHHAQRQATLQIITAAEAAAMPASPR